MKRVDAEKTGWAWFIVCACLVQGVPFVWSPAAAGDALKGKTVYESNCAACHGEKGKGDGPVAAALQPPPMSLASAKTRAKSDSELLHIIRNGRGSMPGWKNQLDEPEMQDVVAYLRTLRD